MVPIHGRLGRGDGVEHLWWELVRGPHLPTDRLDGNAQSQPHADLSTPGTSSNDKYTGNERILGSLDQVRVIMPLLHGCHGILRADACTAARSGGGARARGLFGIGLRAQRHVHAAQEGGVELGLNISRLATAEQFNAMPMCLQVLDAIAGVDILCLSMD